ncbi:hypothetical protein BG22_07845 [Bifidobacterium sp. UTBIF-78]|nr:hypothetical protein BG22_07845 [Bifidobacterium sp. UTBIF-78]
MFSRDGDVPGYDADSMRTDVAPGESLTTTLAYSLRDASAPIIPMQAEGTRKAFRTESDGNDAKGL